MCTCIEEFFNMNFCSLLRHKKKSIKTNLMDFEYFNLKKFSYFNKSKTNDGNKPKAIFKTIDTTAVA
jgi:hypothetical protein